MGLFDIFKKKSDVIKQESIIEKKENTDIIDNGDKVKSVMDLDKKVIDEKTIKLNDTKELFEYIRNNNVEHSKEQMEEGFNYVDFEGYAKDIFNKDLENYVEKDILLELNSTAYENVTMAPGAIISRYGYLVIKTTTGGNAICLDLNSSLENPEVIFADESLFCDKENYFKVDGKLKLLEVNEEVIKKYSRKISDSLENYLKIVESGKLDIEELDFE